MARIDRLQRLLERQAPFEKRAQVQAENFAAKHFARNEDHEYLVKSMRPIEADYTDKTFEEAERVRAQLANGLSPNYFATFDYQGSVTSDTHIRVYSDIDLLVMDGRFITLDWNAPNSAPYQGNITNDLTALRQSSAWVLTQKFPAVTVNNKPGKAIALSGGSLERKIDVVVGNWWDREAYKQTNFKANRGINIIDTKVLEQIRNLPFLHNFRINEKDKKTGALRKAIRFLKTLKYDAEREVKISSYDITSLAWNMADQSLMVAPDSYLLLASNITSELKQFIDNTVRRDSLWVPNETRKVFGSGGATLEGLRALHTEASDLVNRVQGAMALQMFNARIPERDLVKRSWNESLPQSVKSHMY